MEPSTLSACGSQKLEMCVRLTCVDTELVIFKHWLIVRIFDAVRTVMHATKHRTPEYRRASKTLERIPSFLRNLAYVEPVVLVSRCFQSELTFSGDAVNLSAGSGNPGCDIFLTEFALS